MKDMAFDDKGTTRAPLMIWDIAVNSKGIVYFTTYVQVRLEVKTLQRCIGVTAQRGNHQILVLLYIQQVHIYFPFQMIP